MSTKNPSRLASLAFCVALVGVSIALYQWVKGPTIRADEVRIYHQLPSGQPATPLLLHLRGEAARSAASNFVFSADGAIYECLNSGEWYHLVFLDSHRVVKSCELYLPNGQINFNDDGRPPHLLESSRLYWERLIQRGR